MFEWLGNLEWEDILPILLSFTCIVLMALCGVVIYSAIHNEGPINKVLIYNSETGKVVKIDLNKGEVINGSNP